MIAIYLNGYIIGSLLNYMLDKDPVAENHKREMEELAQYIESKQFSAELSARLISYFKFQHQKAVENRASASVPLPRCALKDRVSGFLSPDSRYPLDLAAT